MKNNTFYCVTYFKEGSFVMKRRYYLKRAFAEKKMKNLIDSGFNAWISVFNISSDDFSEGIDNSDNM